MFICCHVIKTNNFQCKWKLIFQIKYSTDMTNFSSLPCCGDQWSSLFFLFFVFFSFFQCENILGKFSLIYNNYFFKIIQQIIQFINNIFNFYFCVIEKEKKREEKKNENNTNETLFLMWYSLFISSSSTWRKKIINYVWDDNEVIECDGEREINFNH